LRPCRRPSAPGSKSGQSECVRCHQKLVLQERSHGHAQRRVPCPTSQYHSKLQCAALGCGFPHQLVAECRQRYLRQSLPCSVTAGDIHPPARLEEHTSELQSRFDLVCRLLLEKNNPLQPLRTTLHV